jgi:hypothetical protein
MYIVSPFLRLPYRPSAVLNNIPVHIKYQEMWPCHVIENIDYMEKSFRCHNLNEINSTFATKFPPGGKLCSMTDVRRRVVRQRKGSKAYAKVFKLQSLKKPTTQFQNTANSVWLASLADW